jgi:hypothetical protein
VTSLSEAKTYSTSVSTDSASSPSHCGRSGIDQSEVSDSPINDSFFILILTPSADCTVTRNLSACIAMSAQLCAQLLMVLFTVEDVGSERNAEGAAQEDEGRPSRVSSIESTQ